MLVIQKGQYDKSYLSNGIATKICMTSLVNNQWVLDTVIQCSRRLTFWPSYRIC